MGWTPDKWDYAASSALSGQNRQLGTLSTIIAPETHIFPKATLLMGFRIAQNFR